MRTRIVLGLLLAVVVAGAAVVRRPRGTEPPAQDALAALLGRPLDAREGSDGAPPFWKALLEPPFAARTTEGITLRLGLVQADPTAARGSAESAGELLALEAEGPAGKLGVPLWRAVLDEAAVEGPEGRTLSLYGCRHAADRDAAPVIEDGYHARLALARALVDLAATEKGAPPLALQGEQMPVRGGVNFEVQLVGETQSVVATFDGRRGPFLRASRTHRPPAPNDGVVRARMVAALRARAAAEPGFPALTIEGADAPLADGVDLRIEDYGERLALVAVRRAGGRLATHMTR